MFISNDESLIYKNCFTLTWVNCFQFGPATLAITHHWRGFGKNYVTPKKNINFNYISYLSFNNSCILFNNNNNNLTYCLIIIVVINVFVNDVSLADNCNRGIYPSDKSIFFPAGKTISNGANAECQL